MYQYEKKKLLSLINEDFLKILKDSGAFIAGGAITSIFSNTEVNDLDIYFPTRDSLLGAIAGIRESSYRVIVTAKTEKALLMQDSETGQYIQFITGRFYPTHESIFETFDFTCNMMAYSFTADSFYFHEDALKHTAQRKLVVNTKTSYPIITMQRVHKYLGRGYTISRLDMMRLGLAVANLQLSSWSGVKEQLGGLYGVSLEDVFDEQQSPDTALDQLVGFTPDVERKVSEVGSVELFEVYRDLLSQSGPLFVWVDGRSFDSGWEKHFCVTTYFYLEKPTNNVIKVDWLLIEVIDPTVLNFQSVSSGILRKVDKNCFRKCTEEEVDKYLSRDKIGEHDANQS